MKKVEHVYREASKLFARYGFEGVTMRDIADACGITMAPLYYHFSSKGELHDGACCKRLKAGGTWSGLTT